MQNTMTTMFQVGDRVRCGECFGTVDTDQTEGCGAVWVRWDERVAYGKVIASHMGWQNVDYIELIPVEAVQGADSRILTNVGDNGCGLEGVSLADVARKDGIEAYNFVSQYHGESWMQSHRSWRSDEVVKALFSLEARIGRKLSEEDRDVFVDVMTDSIWKMGF